MGRHVAMDLLWVDPSAWPEGCAWFWLMQRSSAWSCLSWLACHQEISGRLHEPTEKSSVLARSLLERSISPACA